MKKKIHLNIRKYYLVLLCYSYDVIIFSDLDILPRFTDGRGKRVKNENRFERGISLALRNSERRKRKLQLRKSFL